MKHRRIHYTRMCTCEGSVAKEMQHTAVTQLSSSSAGRPQGYPGNVSFTSDKGLARSLVLLTVEGGLEDRKAEEVRWGRVTELSIDHMALLG